MSYKAVCKYINNFLRNTIYYPNTLKENYIMHETYFRKDLKFLNCAVWFPFVAETLLFYISDILKMNSLWASMYFASKMQNFNWKVKKD